MLRICLPPSSCRHKRYGFTCNGKLLIGGKADDRHLGIRCGNNCLLPMYLICFIIEFHTQIAEIITDTLSRVGTVFTYARRKTDNVYAIHGSRICADIFCRTVNKCIQGTDPSMVIFGSGSFQTIVHADFARP